MDHSGSKRCALRRIAEFRDIDRPGSDRNVAFLVIDPRAPPHQSK
jgi:hypothetical protein